MTAKRSDQKGSKAALIQALRVHGPISRIALTKLTGLSRATISVCIAELIESKLVRETGNREFSGGRPATSLELVERSRAILGAELDRRQWALGAFDLVGNTLATVNVPVDDASPEAAVQALAGALPDFAAKLDVPVVPLLGICTPGLVDTKRGVIHAIPLLGWHNVEFVRMMAKRVDWPVVIVNRDRARGLLECRSRMERGQTAMVYIGVSEGIAAGFYYKGELVTGAFGGAGEVGHMTIEPHGSLCPCGNNGCLQLYCTEPAIEQEARRLLRLGEQPSALSGQDIQLLRAPDVCRAADEGDVLAAAAVDRCAGYLGIALGNIVNLFNPDVIVLGGPLASSCRRYVQTAVKTMRQRAMSPLADRTAVVTSAYNERAGALGAANFALDRHISYSLLNPHMPEPVI